MPNPYAQVALTYVRHAESTARIGYLIAAVVVVLSLLVGSGIAVRFTEPDAYVWLLMNVLCLCLAIVMHAKEQFADSRAHLMPGFRRAHARVAITLALMVAVLLPAAYTLLAGLRSVGLVAISVFLLGAVLWLVLRQLHWLVVLLPMCFFVPKSLAHALDQLVSGQFEACGHWALDSWRSDDRGRRSPIVPAERGNAGVPSPDGVWHSRNESNGRPAAAS